MRRLRPFKKRPDESGLSRRAGWFLGGVAVFAAAVAVMVAFTVAPPKTAAPTVSAPAKVKAVKVAVRGPLGVHEPVQGRIRTSEQAVQAFHYNTDPPTSGPYTAAFPKAYLLSSPLAKGVLVYLESLGNVIIAYHGVSAKTLEAIRSFAEATDTPTPALAERAKAGEGVFVTPWPGVPSGHVVLLAWTRYLDLTGFQAAKARAFTDAFLGNKENVSQ